jgi:hypothetical protein
MNVQTLSTIQGNKNPRFVDSGEQNVKMERYARFSNVHPGFPNFQVLQRPNTRAIISF